MSIYTLSDNPVGVITLSSSFSASLCEMGKPSTVYPALSIAWYTYSGPGSALSLLWLQASTSFLRGNLDVAYH